MYLQQGYIALLFLLGISQCLSVAPTPLEYFGGSGHDAYLTWVNEKGSEYQHSQYMGSSADEANGAAFHWNVDGEFIHLAVAVKATGWVGFGIAEAGGMYGADVVMFEARDPDSVKDMYILDNRMPLEDASQDWILKRSQAEGGFLIFEARRLLDTNDPQDRSIGYDASSTIPPTKVIAAWGDEEEMTYHGPNRARTAVRYRANDNQGLDFEERMEQVSDGYFDMKAEDHLIAAKDTEYAYFCFSKTDLLSLGAPDVDGLYGVGFAPLVDERTAPYVHHFVLYGASETNEEEFEEECEGTEVFDFVYLWAPGELPMTLPEEVASVMFSKTSFNSFQLEIHYNNPEEIEGLLDSSGVRVYYTRTPRQYELGILTLGDPSLSLTGTKFGSGTTEHVFDCPGSCSSEMARENVTVIGEYLHMHQKGVRMYNEQIRDGAVLRTGKVDYWEFYQQGTHAVQQAPFTIMPGDGFRTTCYYHGDGESKFGLSSKEEMCMAFLFYYPKQVKNFGPWAFPWTCGYDIGVPACLGGWETEELVTGSSLGRTFGFLNDGTVEDDGRRPSFEESVGSPAEIDIDRSEEASSGAWKSSLLVSTLVVGLLSLVGL